ncbi:hypothetical protein O1611_g9121 [Lasiodiplodia mahajangana]|uniref:Uncharacterized protein n=1 Tax=Lasiodiplodia mahajangana TaxID=1108764 RepID=A0ACC2JAH8_9PEZI|nr:hypothetical protein O1611_g9121 [Lasiodiplodia mahajangana]
MAAWNLESRLSTFSIGLSAVVAISTYIVWYFVTVIKSWYRLRQFPGPLYASFSYLWGYYAMATGRMHLRLAEEQEKYGKIMRIGPNELLVYDPQTLWHINNVRSSYERGGWYGSIQFDPYGHSVLSEPDTAKHDKRKAKLAAGYAGKGVVNLEAKVDSQLEVLISLLKRKYLGKGKSHVVDFSRLIRFFQIDIVTLAGSGEPWGNLATETDQFDFIAIADSIVKDVVAKRFDDSDHSKKTQGDMLDEWINHGMTRRECELELAIQVPAGSETSTTAIRGIMLHLLSSPQAYQKLQDEITAGIREGRISSPVTNEEARRLPYLQAVLNEGLRMVPPAITGFPKKVPPGGDTLCGKFVPEGTDVFVNFWSMLRSKDVFGHDAEVFRPERFIECDEEKRIKLMSCVDLAFGHGRWQCPGKTLAWLELNKIFVELLRTCDLQIVNPQAPWRCRGYSSFLIDDFWVRLIEKA